MQSFFRIGSPQLPPVEKKKKYPKRRLKCKAVCKDPGMISRNQPNRVGTPCTQYALHDSDLCVMHDPRSIKRRRSQRRTGPKNGYWKDGAMSKYKDIVPTRMQRVLNDLADNPDWIRSKDEILLLEARVIELLQQLNEGGTSGAVKNARVIVEEVFQAIASEDGDAAHKGLVKLQAILESGDAESSEIWKEIQETLSERRRTVEQERRVIETATNVLRPDELIWLATRIAAISRKYLSEKQWPDFTMELEDLILLRDKPTEYQPITSRLEAVIDQGIVEQKLIDVKTEA